MGEADQHRAGLTGWSAFRGIMERRGAIIGIRSFAASSSTVGDLARELGRAARR